MISESFFCKNAFVQKSKSDRNYWEVFQKNIVIIISVTQLAEETYIILQEMV